MQDHEWLRGQRRNNKKLTLHITELMMKSKKGLRGSNGKFEI